MYIVNRIYIPVVTVLHMLFVDVLKCFVSQSMVVYIATVYKIVIMSENTLLSFMVATVTFVLESCINSVWLDQMLHFLDLWLELSL